MAGQCTLLELNKACRATALAHFWVFTFLARLEMNSECTGACLCLSRVVLAVGFTPQNLLVRFIFCRFIALRGKDGWEPFSI